MIFDTAIATGQIIDETPREEAANWPGPDPELRAEHMAREREERQQAAYERYKARKGRHIGTAPNCHSDEGWYAHRPHDDADSLYELEGYEEDPRAVLDNAMSSICRAVLGGVTTPAFVNRWLKDQGVDLSD